MSSSKITAVVIAKNEEEMIEACLESLSFVDKLLIIDTGSEDRTVEIAKKHGATVVKTDLKSFAEIRELALSKITAGYVLYIDADERVSEDLQKEIRKTLSNNPEYHAYKIPRQNYYLGKNPWPSIEYLERLFLRSAIKGWKGELHESPIIEGKVGVLESTILHFTHRNFTSMVDKTNSWSETEALLRLKANHPRVTWWRFPRVMLTAFIDSYIKQQGWKIGLPGLLESMYQSFSIFITYAKLWEYQQRKQS